MRDDMLSRGVTECAALCQEHFPDQYKRLQTIPWVKERAATSIIAETGADMLAFEKSSNLVGWCGLKPRNDISNCKMKSRKIPHGDKYLRQILIEVAWISSRTKNCFFSNFSYEQEAQKHKSKMKVQVAIAHKILVAVWHMLSKREDFIDLYLKRLEERAKMEADIQEIESSMGA